jgi:PadR family transcriptional regulator, regulatory protein AphA
MKSKPALKSREKKPADDGQGRDRTRYLILGLLAEGPATGYDIRRITALRYRFFWSESYGQIYPGLRRLAKEGLVRLVESENEGRARHLHEITDAGRSALSAWIASPSGPDIVRSEALLKLYFIGEGPGGALRERLIEFRDEARQSLSLFEAAMQELLSIPDPRGEHANALRTVRLGLATSDVRLKWAENELRNIKEEDYLDERN